MIPQRLAVDVNQSIVMTSSFVQLQQSTLINSISWLYSGCTLHIFHVVDLFFSSTMTPNQERGYIYRFKLHELDIMGFIRLIFYILLAVLKT